jgi:hypothetical protein
MICESRANHEVLFRCDPPRRRRYTEIASAEGAENRVNESPIVIDVPDTLGEWRNIKVCSSVPRTVDMYQEMAISSSYVAVYDCVDT